MSHKSTLSLIMLITAVLISGCTDKDNTNPSTVSDLIPTKNLPDGFTYMGMHNVNLTFTSSLINATEGVYRTGKGEDFYIQVIENGNPEALISQYKQQYKNFSYDPFQEIYLNGHKATQVTDYTTINGKQQPNYAVTWATGKAMILVSSPTADAQSVIALASATKS